MALWVGGGLEGVLAGLSCGLECGAVCCVEAAPLPGPEDEMSTLPTPLPWWDSSEQMNEPRKGPIPPSQPGVQAAGLQRPAGRRVACCPHPRDPEAQTLAPGVSLSSPWGPTRGSRPDGTQGGPLGAPLQPSGTSRGRRGKGFCSRVPERETEAQARARPRLGRRQKRDPK